jgi:hypothetical protein
MRKERGPRRRWITSGFGRDVRWSSISGEECLPGRWVCYAWIQIIEHMTDGDGRLSCLKGASPMASIIVMKEPDLGLRLGDASEVAELRKHVGNSWGGAPKKCNIFCEGENMRARCQTTKSRWRRLKMGTRAGRSRGGAQKRNGIRGKPSLLRRVGGVR